MIQMQNGFPIILSPALATPGGTAYLREPGVSLLAKPDVNIAGLAPFLDDFAPELHFPQYLDDPTVLPHAAQLCKTAGQLCYMSFAPKRTQNDEAARYFRNILESGHGSVLEHAHFSFLFYGISRSVTHELVRHRSGFGYCLIGETEIACGYKSRGRHRVTKRKLSQLHEMTQTPSGCAGLKRVRLRCLDEQANTFTQGCIKQIVCSGIKPVFRVELEDGKTVTCSREHRFLTPSGWKPLEEIAGGLTVMPNGWVTYNSSHSLIYVNGIRAYRDCVWLKARYIEENMSLGEVAQLAGSNLTTIKKWLRKFGIKKALGVRTRWTTANTGKLYTSREWLQEHYIGKNMEQEAIAELAGVTTHTIRSWVRKHQLQKSAGSWAIGRAPWNQGRRYKANWTHTPEMRQRFAEQKNGANNPQWKGGITKKAVRIRRAAGKLRTQVYQRDSYCCRLCGERGGRLTLHHILPIWARIDLAQDVDNLAAVCQKCHLKINGHEADYVEQFGRSSAEIPAGAVPIRGSGHLLIPRLRHIKQITYAGEQMTYDIEMQAPHYNFVANGIITHNSQVSQRYVSGRVLRFVERPEYQNDAELHSAFERRIDQAAGDYEQVAQRLLADQKAGSELLSGEARTDLRKKVQQAARSVLPNETEAPIIVTGNVRAWRHFVEMRANAHAETEIRALAFRAFLCLLAVEPLLFADYAQVTLPDGTQAVETQFRKV